MSLDLDLILSNSFCDFHAKGVDYVCLARSPKHTVKLYFFDRVTREVVNPHNHRYNFDSRVLKGSVRDNHWTPASDNKINPLFDKFTWRTPLNGGAGFKFECTQPLRAVSAQEYFRDFTWSTFYHTIHTLDVLEPYTVMLQIQHEDVFPIHVPTHTWKQSTPGNLPPHIGHLYRRMTREQLLNRFEYIRYIGHDPEELARI